LNCRRKRLKSEVIYSFGLCVVSKVNCFIIKTEVLFLK